MSNQISSFRLSRILNKKTLSNKKTTVRSAKILAFVSFFGTSTTTFKFQTPTALSRLSQFLTTTMMMRIKTTINR